MFPDTDSLPRCLWVIEKQSKNSPFIDIAVELTTTILKHTQNIFKNKDLLCFDEWQSILFIDYIHEV